MAELRSCVKVEVAVLGSVPNKPTVSVDAKPATLQQLTEYDTEPAKCCPALRMFEAHVHMLY